MSLFWIIFFFLFGLAVLIKGADIFVDGSAGIARRFQIPDFFIGVTLVALGTSLPELIVSLIASLSNNSNLAIGNVVGSNIANIALILGVCGILKTIRIQPQTLIKRDIPFLILSGVVLLILSYDQIFQDGGINVNRLTTGDGLILLTFFVIFLFFIFGNLKSSQTLEATIEEKSKKQSKQSLMQLIMMIIGGLIAVIGGGKLVVDNAIIMAELLGVSKTFIGLTIVALGTSLPEAVITISAVRKNKADIALGNIIGSNTLNIFFILGLVATFSPFSLSNAIISDIIMMTAITIILFFISFFRKEIGRISGLFLLVSYLMYLLYLILRQ